MQKGIGAAPFAIVAALIVALAAGLWATQPAQAQTAGDLTLGFPASISAETVNGPAELDASIDATAAKAGITFRGSTDRGSSVQVTAAVQDASATAVYPLQVTVTGPASLKSSGAQTTGTCDVAAASCVFTVYTTGTAGEFSVRASAATGRLTDSGINDPKTIKGQWVGPAVTAEVLKKAPANSAVDLDDGSDTTPAVKITDLFGNVSPSAIVGGFTPGLLGSKVVDNSDRSPTQTGFLFQLADSAGQAPLALLATDRAAPRVDIITDSADEDVTLKFAVGVLSVPASGDANLSNNDKTVYVAIGNEAALVTGTQYPVLDDARVNTADPPTGSYRAGGLIAVALDGSSVALGKAALGKIVVQLSGGETIEHAIAIAGDPAADRSSVSAPGTPVHLGLGDKHTRTVSLRDANGTPVPGSASVIVPAETDAAKQDLYITVAEKSGSAGDYTLTIWANEEQSDDIAADPTASPAVEAKVNGGIPDAQSRDADLGSHAFTVRINKLVGGTQVVKKSADADGNPLEAHIAGGITRLSVASVTHGGDELTIEDGAVMVPQFSTLQITLEAVGKDGLAPKNGSEVTPRDGTGGFAGGGTTGYVGKTNDAGEVTLTYGSGTVTQRVSFTAGDGAAVASLLVRVADPDAPAADTGPTIYSLAGSAGATFHSWDGGDSSSAVFENVANLVIVWKWTGNMWVGYNANPNAPAATKTSFTLQNGDTLWVVANGAVDLLLD
jgi:hypothetical protein